jgi:ribosomal protein L29
MAASAMSELRGLPEAELRQRIRQSRQELAAMRLRASQGALERPHEIGARRREIARLMTVLNELGQRAAGASAAPSSPRPVKPAKPVRQAARGATRTPRRQPAKTR